ncbi:MAG: hypothetical protein IPH75_05315 [bacterium]|nr:hypothetical protein [bacterium]
MNKILEPLKVVFLVVIAALLLTDIMLRWNEQSYSMGTVTGKEGIIILNGRTGEAKAVQCGRGSPQYV